jgi:hypothetical protein
MLKKTITQFLSVPNANIFDGCVEAIEIEHGRPVTNLCDLKKREDKKKKGDLWEVFCRDWLEASDKYKNVWLFHDWVDYCSEKQISSKGLKSKQDNGIDIIVEFTNGKYAAVQCKYRKDMKKVTWNTLSTFIGLCERTGPWEQYIVMTNGRGVTRKVPKSKKDKSICVGTFRGTSRTQWLKMAGLYDEKTASSQENKRTEERRTEDRGSEERRTEDRGSEDGKQEVSVTTELGTSIQTLMKKYAQPKKKDTEKKIKGPSLDELREIRIRKFSEDNKIE